MTDTRILLGVVGRPHGVRGLLHVHVQAEDPASLELYGELLDDKGRAWRLRWERDGVARLTDAEGRAVADRNAAEALVNMRLYVDRARLPAPEADEFYLTDLVGLEAFGADGAVLGRIAVVHDYGAGASLEIVGEGPPLLVPFTRACVPDVDVAGGRVTVLLPGFVDVAPDGAEDAA
jgi:16S rRNA processing protein RimM